MPYLSAYSAKSLQASFKKLVDICPVFEPSQKKKDLKGLKYLPNIPLGWAIVFPLESAIDFNILTLKDSRDFELSLISWETIGSIIKLHEKFRWFNNTKSLWISPEDIISQVGKQFILIKRVNHSSLISTFQVSAFEYQSNIVKNTEYDSSINSNVPIFLFTLPDKFPLNVEINNNIPISYSNMATNIKCVQQLCEASFVALSQHSISRFKLNLELSFTENSIFYYNKSENSAPVGHVEGLYKYMDLFISFPTKFSSILEKDLNAVLQLDKNNLSNFLFKVPKIENRFNFIHHDIPFINSNIRPPFFLQLRNSYNLDNIEINGKSLCCLAILNEKDTNMLHFAETFQTEFNPSCNQFLQFVVSDNNNNVIFLHPDSLIIISIFSNIS